MFLKLKKYIPSAIWFHVLQLETKEFLKEHKVIFIFFFILRYVASLDGTSGELRSDKGSFVCKPDVG